MTLIELLVVIGILAGLVLLISPVAGKFIRRSQGLAAYSTVQQVLATARLQAVKRGSNVVVRMDLVNLSPKPGGNPPSWRLRFLTFQDRANDEENPLPADEQTAAGNFQQDTTFIKPNVGEPTLGEVYLPANMIVQKQGGTENDMGEAVAFDGYLGDTTTLVNRIAFLPTGGIAPPEDATTSGPPTPTGGRGIYFADHWGKNFFRVTIDSELSGRLRVDKFLETAGYQPSGWAWY